MFLSAEETLKRRDVEEAVASVTAEKGHILLFALLQTISIQNAILVLDSLVFVEKFRRRVRSSLSPDAEFRYFTEECYRDILDAASSEISEKRRYFMMGNALVTKVINRIEPVLDKIISNE